MPIDIPTIPEFFCGKNIFITGGTGFIGEVLIEKLLQSCPQLENIYVLIRPKPNRTVEKRLEDLLELAVFDLLKEQNPKVLGKLIPIEGDVSKLGLGLNENDRAKLIEHVNIVYHSSASIRFDDHLQKAIFTNTRSVRELSYLVLEMKHIEVVLDISTSYCNCDRKEIDEVLYPSKVDWRDAIRLAEEMDSRTLDILTPQYIHPLPNTYTFSKALGEQVINDLCVGRIPVVILRPSIVGPSMHEPIKGWTANFSGPIGSLTAIGKGVLRTLWMDPNVAMDFVPVDVVARAIIAASWKKATTKKNSLTIYNICNNGIKCMYAEEILKYGLKMVRERIHVDNIIWYPDVKITTNRTVFFIRTILYQVLPALLIDGMLKLFGQQPRLLKIQRKIYIALTMTHYFAMNMWTFKNNNFRSLDDQLMESDRNGFNAMKLMECMDKYEYFETGVDKGRIFLLKQQPSANEHAKMHLRRMWFLHIIVTVLYYVFLAWLLLYKINIFQVIFKRCFRLQEYFNYY